MSILAVENLSKQYAERIILDNVNFQLANGDRVGLVGANGSGKSTLLKILAREMDPDSGHHRLTGQVTLSYLPQAFEPLGHLTVAAWLHAAGQEIHDMQERMAHLSTKMAEVTGNGLEQIIVEYGDLATRFEQRGGYDLPHRMEAVLQGLGISDIDHARQLTSLSGPPTIRRQLRRGRFAP